MNTCGCTGEASSSPALRSHLAHASPGTVGRKGPGSKSSTCCRQSAPLYILIGVGTIVLLILGAHSLPSGQPRRSHADSHPAPPPWVVGLILGAMGFVWAIFFLLGWGPVLSQRPSWNSSGRRTRLGHSRLLLCVEVDIEVRLGRHAPFCAGARWSSGLDAWRFCCLQGRRSASH